MSVKKYTCAGIVLLILTFIGTQTALAASRRTDYISTNDTPYDDYCPVGLPFVVTLSAGPDLTSTGKTQTFYLQSDIENTYIRNNKIKALATGEIFVGLQRNLNLGMRRTESNRFKGQLGLALAGSSVVRTNGTILQDADPLFNNFNYTYHISQVRLTLKSKFIAEIAPTTPFLEAYLSGGMGIGVNRASNFQATPLICEAVVAPGFTNSNYTAFTYTLGAGIQKSFAAHWQVGIGYEFADWGASSLGRAPGQTLNTGLRANQLYTNELQFSLSYLA